MKMFPVIKRCTSHVQFVHEMPNQIDVYTRQVLYWALVMLQVVIDVPPPPEMIDPKDCETYVNVTYGLDLDKSTLKRYKKHVAATKQNMIDTLQKFAELVVKGVEYQLQTALSALLYLYWLVEFLRAEVDFFAPEMYAVITTNMDTAMGSDMMAVMQHQFTVVERMNGQRPLWKQDLDQVPPDIIFYRLAASFGVICEKCQEHIPDDQQLAAYERAVST